MLCFIETVRGLTPKEENKTPNRAWFLETQIIDSDVIREIDNGKFSFHKGRSFSQRGW